MLDLQILSCLSYQGKTTWGFPSPPPPPRLGLNSSIKILEKMEAPENQLLNCPWKSNFTRFCKLFLINVMKDCRYHLWILYSSIIKRSEVIVRKFWKPNSYIVTSCREKYGRRELFGSFILKRVKFIISR